MSGDFALRPQGDRAVLAQFREEISPDVSSQVVALCSALDAGNFEGIVGCVPAYRTLTVEYDPRIVSYRRVCRMIRAAAKSAGNGSRQGRVVRIPVLYGGEMGPDLQDVADQAGMSQEEVVRRHTAPEYRVYMLGFRPGFPYLGGLDESIATPRRPSPRQRIEAGSVGIAGSQTGIYPEESPGGWNIIGRTPIKLFDKEKMSALLEPGDTLKFEAVDMETYRLIEERGVWPFD